MNISVQYTAAAQQHIAAGCVHKIAIYTAAVYEVFQATGVHINANLHDSNSRA